MERHMPLSSRIQPPVSQRKVRFCCRPRLTLLEERTLMATVSWINPSGGDWDVPANWSTGQLPGLADDVVINMPGITISHGSGTDAVNSLTSADPLIITGGSLAVATSSTTTSDIEISGCTFSVAATATLSVGGVLMLENNASLSGGGVIDSVGGLSITNNLSLNNVTLNNDGVATWSEPSPAGALNIDLESGAVINNLAGATFALVGTGQYVMGNTDGSAVAFNNYGSLTSSTTPNSNGNDRAEINTNFVNSGTVSVLQGELDLSGNNAVNSGTFAGSAGTYLDIASEVLSSSAAINSQGTVELDYSTDDAAYSAGSSVFFADTLTGPIGSLGATVTIHNTVTFTPGAGGAATLSTNSLNIVSGGNLAGVDSFVVNSSLTLSDGSELSTTGTVDSYGSLMLTPVNRITLRSVTLNNHGDATWSEPSPAGALNIDLESGAVINNLAGATFALVGTGQYVMGNTDGSAVAFNNYGSLTSSTTPNSNGNDRAEINTNFVNSGTVSVLQGELDLSGNNAVNSGTFAGSAGTYLDIASEVLSSSAAINSQGTVELDYSTDDAAYSAGSSVFFADTLTGPIGSLGATVTIHNTVTFTPGAGGAATLSTNSLNIVSGGNLAGVDSFVVNSSLTLSDGSELSTTGTVDSYGSLMLTPVNRITLRSVTLNNHGDATWSEPSPAGALNIDLESGAMINNLAGATFALVGTGQYVMGNTDGSAVAFNNYGSLTSSTTPNSNGNDRAEINTNFVNSGTVSVLQGELDFGNVSNSGTVEVQSSAALSVSIYTQTAGATILNGGQLDGTIVVNAGLLSGTGTISGNVTNSGQVDPGGVGVAGSITINGTYIQTTTGVLNFDLGGTTAGTGYDQLVVSGAAALAGQFNFSLINGFAPALGNSFQVLTYVSSSGDFSYGDLDLGNRLMLGHVLNSTNLTLTVQPDSLPVVGPISGPTVPVSFATTVSVASPFTDVETYQTHTAQWSWGDGSNSAGVVVESNGSGTITGSHVYTAAGPFTITLTVTDSDGGSGQATFQVTVVPSILVLDKSENGALTLSGNASINTKGALVVDSSSSSAIFASGNSQIKASVIDVNGGVKKSGNASLSPAPVTGTAIVLDPFASLPAPSASGLTNYGSKNVSGNSSVTINPGIYTSITVSGNGKLTMNPGVYIIKGGGLKVSGNASVVGTGVLIYNEGGEESDDCESSGAVTFSGNGSITLSPPTGGTYAGILIFQSRHNTQTMSLSGNSMLGLSGTIYAPDATLIQSGNGQIGTLTVVVNEMTLSGNAIANAQTLDPPPGATALTPAQIRTAYGINNVLLDGTGQTIAIVDAYDDPAIALALDTFDTQFGLTSNGPTLYQEYGPAAAFLTVVNQSGQTTSLPTTDPSGTGSDNWEVEAALDVEWAHAIAPGAKIVLVEANSQSLSDLMAAVASASAIPGVSVVSMSWGFAEGQQVFAADEAAYNSYFQVPGVTFVASTGDYGAADPQFPAYSPYVVSVGGTSLALNSDNSYQSETGWGYYSSAAGAFIGSGGGLSLYQPEPTYQLGVQSTGSRSTPDVSLVADPATGELDFRPLQSRPEQLVRDRRRYELVCPGLGRTVGASRPGPGCCWRSNSGFRRSNGGFAGSLHAATERL